MSKKALILLGIIGLLIIFLLCAMMHLRSIEKDIADCSNDILNNAQFTNLTADTHDLGRTVMVTGTVESDDAKQKALDLLKDQCHMTGLFDSINVVIPKPTKQPHFSFSFNDKGQLAQYNGTVAKVSVENNLIGAFKNYKFANSMKGSSIVGNKDVIPMNYEEKIKTVLPYINDIKMANIAFNGKQITLKGEVVSQNVKNLIASRISKTLGNEVKINNLLSIALVTIQEPKMVIQKPLDAKDCQKELSQLLSNSMVHFNSGSATIKKESTNLLNKLAETTKSCQKVKIVVIGHTDKSGNENSNIQLSKARALAVSIYLTNSGVQKEKLSARGVGSALPIATNNTAEGRSQNRRIEFKVHSL